MGSRATLGVLAGFHWTVPPILRGTVGQDGQWDLGLHSTLVGLTWCTGGIPQYSPTYPTWYSGTGRIEPLLGKGGIPLGSPHLS